jgi:hypothetical protein
MLCTEYVYYLHDEHFSRSYIQEIAVPQNVKGLSVMTICTLK